MGLPRNMRRRNVVAITSGTLMILSLVLLLAQSTLEPLNRSTLEPLQWIDVVNGKWTRLGITSDGNALVLYRPWPTVPRSAWIRYEFGHRLGPSGEFSARELVKYDCASGTSITLERQNYSQINLTGQQTILPGSESPTYVAPDSFDHMVFELVCGAEG